MAIVFDWKIKNRTGVCCHTEKPFADEEPFYTCIFDDPESDGFIRRDYSVEAWQEIGKNFDPPPFSFWKSVHKEKEEDPRNQPMKQNSVEAMLHRMIEEALPETENARYILALMLERKKILIPTEVKETENNTLLFYEHKDSGAVYIVADPNLHLEEVGAIQEEVSALLEAEEKRGQAPEPEVEKPDEAQDGEEASSSEGEDKSTSPPDTQSQ